MKAKEFGNPWISEGCLLHGANERLWNRNKETKFSNTFHREPTKAIRRP